MRFGYTTPAIVAGIAARREKPLGRCKRAVVRPIGAAGAHDDRPAAVVMLFPGKR